MLQALGSEDINPIQKFFLNKRQSGWACTQLDSHTSGVHTPIGEFELLDTKKP